MCQNEDCNWTQSSLLTIVQHQIQPQIPSFDTDRDHTGKISVGRNFRALNSLSIVLE